MIAGCIARLQIRERPGFLRMIAQTRGARRFGPNRHLQMQTDMVADGSANQTPATATQIDIVANTIFRTRFPDVRALEPQIAMHFCGDRNVSSDRSRRFTGRVGCAVLAIGSWLTAIDPEMSRSFRCSS